MASKQAQAKIDQNWKGPGEGPTCSNCRHFTFDKEKVSWGDHFVEKKLRCTKGEFATKKTAYCGDHQYGTPNGE